jgi:hypothetical protein
MIQSARPRSIVADRDCRERICYTIKAKSIIFPTKGNQEKLMAFPKDWRSAETEISRLIARSWLEPELYNNLLTRPTATLREAGLIEDFVEVEVNQSPDAVPVLRGTQGETVIYVLALPPKPDDLKDEQISNWIDGRAEILPGGLRVCCS